MNFRKGFKAEPPGFQITPMIDIVFLLLCFTITSQLYARWETEIDITLPTAETGEVLKRLPGEIILNIGANGEVVFNGRVLNEEKLSALLAKVVELFPNQAVVIRADGKTPYEKVVAVLDVCRKADVWNISFATLMPEKGR